MHYVDVVFGGSEGNHQGQVVSVFHNTRWKSTLFYSRKKDNSCLAFEYWTRKRAVEVCSVCPCHAWRTPSRLRCDLCFVWGTYYRPVNSPSWLFLETTGCTVDMSPGTWLVGVEHPHRDTGTCMSSLCTAGWLTCLWYHSIVLKGTL